MKLSMQSVDALSFIFKLEVEMDYNYLYANHLSIHIVLKVSIYHHMQSATFLFLFYGRML